MFRRAGDAADQVVHSREIEATLHFAIDYFAHQSGLASFLGGRAALERFSLRGGETDGKGGFHARNLPCVRQIARRIGD